MTDQETIDAIRADRNQALDALEDALVSVDREIENTDSADLAYLKQLKNRSQSLMDERTTIMDAASVAILSMPSVVAAADQLNAIAAKMKATAQEIPNATDKLTKATAILSLGQKFTDLIASTQKGG